MNPAARVGERATATNEVRAVIDAWLDAIHRRDLDGVVAAHADDVLLFDVGPDTRLRGLLAYEHAWREFLDALGTEGRFELHDLHVVASADVAYSHAILACNPGGAPMPSAPTIRLTLALERRAGVWLITHEHHSTPFEATE